MFETLIGKALGTVLTLGSAYIIGYVGKFMSSRKKLLDEQIKEKEENKEATFWQKVEKKTWELIKAAAQSIPEKDQRYDWVAQQLKAKFPILTAVDLKSIIEAAVYNLKAEAAARGVTPTTVDVDTRIAEAVAAEMKKIEDAKIKAALDAGKKIQFDAFGNIREVE